MSDKAPFRIEKKGHVGFLILARPEKRNLMDGDFFSQTRASIQQLDQDPEVRVVVIKAEGKSFTAGLDLNWAGAIIGGGTGADAREMMRRGILELQEDFNAIEKCNKPVICAMHSHCIGGGVDLACACDIRMASADAIFSIREVKLGIVADLGTLQRMQSIVGQSMFRELAYTGRDFTAEEALAMGFVSRVLPDPEALWEEAEKLAKEIADQPPLAVQGIKDVILYSRDNGVYPGLRYVVQKNAAALPSEDLMEAATAFLQKRKPVFKGK